MGAVPGWLSDGERRWRRERGMERGGGGEKRRREREGEERGEGKRGMERGWRSERERKKGVKERWLMAG